QPETTGSGGQLSKAPVQPGDVHALARLEPASGLLIVGARPGARIERIEVGPAEGVTPGQVLAILEGHDQAQAQLALAEAQKTRALHQRSVQKQKLALEREQFDKELVPRQRKLEDEELGEKGPDLDLLDRQTDLARAGLAQTEVRAPFGGRVLELMAHAGEVSSGPLLAMGDLSAIVATAEIFQTDIPRLRTGDPATVRVLDQVVTGKVTLIGSIVGKNQLTNLDPRALQDRRVVKVTIGLDNPALAARFVNMEVEAAIKPGARSAAESAAGAAGR